MTGQVVAQPYSSYTQMEEREYRDEEGTYTERESVLRCSLCEAEMTGPKDHPDCTEGVFAYAAESLTGSGIRFYQRRVSDGYQLWENDTLLLLVQGQLTPEGFNTRVRKIYERDNPGRTFTGWAFELSFKTDGPFDGSGRITTPNEKVSAAVAEALHDLAQQLDARKYRAEVSWA